MEETFQRESVFRLALVPALEVTTLFASTKRGSNDVVGCLGLGSESPFASNSRGPTVADR
jgi:hypothetical protein